MATKIITDTKYILNKNLSIIVLYINIFFSLANFINNVKVNYDRIYISEMYEISKLLLLSDWSAFGFFYMIIFPLIVVLPTYSLIMNDIKSGMKSYIIVRANNYFFRIVSVFISTFILFFFPLFIEWLLSIICFEVSANGDPSNFPYYITANEYIIYPLSRIYSWNKLFYSLLWIIIFSCICGVFAVINLSISTILKFKYRIFAMLPVYLMLNCVSALDSVNKRGYTYNYINMLRMFSYGKKNYLISTVVIIFILIISIILFVKDVKKSEF